MKVRAFGLGVSGVLHALLLGGCVSTMQRTFVIGEQAQYARNESAILLVSRGNQVSAVDNTQVKVTGRYPEDEIALPPGQHTVKANQAGRPIRSGTATIDAKAGHLYRLVGTELPIENLTISFGGGPPVNMGSGSFYSPEINEVTNAVVVGARFSSSFTSTVVRVKLGGQD